MHVTMVKIGRKGEEIRGQHKVDKANKLNKVYKCTVIRDLDQTSVQYPTNLARYSQIDIFVESALRSIILSLFVTNSNMKSSCGLFSPKSE